MQTSLHVLVVGVRCGVSCRLGLLAVASTMTAGRACCGAGDTQRKG